MASVIVLFFISWRGTSVFSNDTVSAKKKKKNLCLFCFVFAFVFVFFFQIWCYTGGSCLGYQNMQGHNYYDTKYPNLHTDACVTWHHKMSRKSHLLVSRYRPFYAT